MKIAQLVERLKKNRRIDCLLVHTGQHYDFDMSEVFFQDLRIPKPDIFLSVGSGSHAEQTAKIMTSFESVLLDKTPDLVVVAGDVNSTLACSLTAAKLDVKVAHIESGLRSFDRTMPEEINRIVTDTLSDFHFVSERSGLENLAREGANKKGTHLVGSIMIDPLVSKMRLIDRSGILKALEIKKGDYAVLTLHRPGNVDSADSLAEVFEILAAVSEKIKLVYPLHPRTKQSLKSNGMLDRFRDIPGLLMTEPLGYLDFMKLVKDSRFVLTDSGGIQEETTYLNIPCLTMRENTERPSTIEFGTNELVGRDKVRIVKAVDRILKGRWKQGRVPRYWDGKTTERILEVITKP